jgi:hypothetical protein
MEQDGGPGTRTLVVVTFLKTPLRAALIFLDRFAMGVVTNDDDAEDTRNKSANDLGA